MSKGDGGGGAGGGASAGGGGGTGAGASSGPSVSPALMSEYQRLREREVDTYNPDSFPGSRAWNTNREARRALQAFEQSHPDVVRKVKSDK